MRNRIFNFILVVLLVAGIGLLSYPTISNLWNQAHTSRAVAVYEDAIQEIDTAAIEEELEKARTYNEKLLAAPDKDLFALENAEEYESILNMNGNGVMGYVEIPSISTTLTIYHGTEESVLQIAAGHLEWTSLPIGGEGTHSVISGHTGLPSAKLFTDLDQLKEKDIFQIHILNEVLYYEVDQIEVVLPEEAGSLMPEEGQDYCTLITCTPYGINSHRLLVRGHRIYPTFNTSELKDDVNPVSPLFVSGIIIVGVGIIYAGIYTVRKRKFTTGKERISG